MAVRTTVDIPGPLHETLRHRALKSGTSVRSLIIQALEQAYAKPKTGRLIMGSLITGKGKLGPNFPVDQNPYDLILSQGTLKRISEGQAPQHPNNLRQNW